VSAMEHESTQPVSRAFDRRSVLLGGLGLGGLVVLGSRADARVTLWGSPRTSQSGDKPAVSSSRTLVLLQLTGGNDGLSMVVPFADDGYNAAREATRIDKADVHKLDAYRGLHPNLKGVKALWDEGRVALIEGCGYPRPIRSHFQSYEVWHTGSERGRLAGEGWIGKLCEQAFSKDATPELVVHVGATAPYSVYSLKHPPLAFQTPATYRWAGTESDDMQAYRKAAEADMKELEKKRRETGQQKMLERLRGVLDDANESSLKIRRAAASYTPVGKYPEDDLGESLRLAAALVDARLGSRVISVELSGFDTHQNQRAQHDTLMRRLDAALTAFMADIEDKSAAGEVVVMVFSEFGRRVKENGSRGTDHGVAAPMMVIGHKVKGGLYGKHPSLTDLDEGDLKHTTDFRSVYGTVIDRWFGADHTKVLGAKYATHGFLPV
jgi:uncharacterized protein (DUF1501 family)